MKYRDAGDAIPMSEYATIVGRVAQMVAVLLYLNHVIASWREGGKSISGIPAQCSSGITSSSATEFA